MASERKLSGTYIPFVIVIIIALAVGAFAGHAYNPGSPSSTTTVAQLTTTQITTISTTTMSTTSVPSIVTSSPSSNASENSTIVQVLYSNKTITIPAAQRNYVQFNYVTGCYWIDGYSVISFNLPYAGYIVFNESNTGIPTNFTEAYFGAYFSTEKPRYVSVSSYNESYWCTGETVQTNVAPVVSVLPYNNQTMIIPVVNGTNYVILYNWNSYDKKGILPFAINVTFNMKYYGFKDAKHVAVPPYDFNATVTIPWSKYS